MKTDTAGSAANVGASGHSSTSTSVEVPDVKGEALKTGAAAKSTADDAAAKVEATGASTADKVEDAATSTMGKAEADVDANIETKGAASVN